MMKKTISLMLICVICFCTSLVLANNFNIIVDSVDAKRGETVDVKIMIQNNPGLIAATLKLEYDRERLELVGAIDGNILEGGTFSQTYDAYPYVMLWNSASHTDFTDDGTLVTLTFKINDDAKNGDAFVGVSCKASDIYNVDLKDVPFNVMNGKVKIGSSVNRIPSGTVVSSGKQAVTQNVSPKMILTIDKKEAMVDGNIVENDVAPIIRNARTMLPARFVAENLGATVEWNENSRKVTIKNKTTEIVILIDSDKALVNGSEVSLDSPAFIENGRTYTPIRFIAESLDSKVEWDEKSKTVRIYELEK